ncbi:MAG: PEP-CTERM sorting domain-containing protein [Burkholderiales bacterium]|nr:PEP-CTERM sorting domain-containing protein [Burkholderiales bacterium]
MPTFSSTLAGARAPFLLAPILAALAVLPAHAADIVIGSNSTTAQSLTASQKLTVNPGASLTVSGGSVAVTLKGNNATVDNQGTISQTGSGRAIRDNTGVSGVTINNGSAANSAAQMLSADADVVQMNVSPAGVTLNNYGAMISSNASRGGAQAVDFNAIASGANVVNNYATGLLKALEADAVRPGADGIVNNAGTILSVTTSGSSSDGIDGQANSGIAVANGGRIEGGRHGITGGAVDANSAYTMAIANAAGGVIRGDNGSGVNLDGFNGKQVVTVSNAGLIVGHGVTGDGDGVDVDGLLNLVNTGVIRSLDAVPGSGETVAFSEGISVGGGTITNSGTIEGLAGNAAARGIGVTLTGNDITSGANAGKRDGLYGDTGVTNQAGGLIRGQNSSAIVAKGLASGFRLTIANNAGATLQGGGTTDAAVQLGADAATVGNAGRIDGSSSHVAIAGGSGNLSVHITGGQAVVLGDIVGGVGAVNRMTLDPGAGNTFAFASGVANFSSVEIASGTVLLSGQNTYTGTTTVDAGATLVLQGAGRLAAGSALDLEGGSLKLVDVQGANGQAFAVLSLGRDSAIDLGGSSLTVDALGHVVAGQALTVTDWLAAASPGYALRFAGDLTGDAAFLALMSDTTIDGLGTRISFDGTYTDVTAVPEPSSLALLLAGLGLVGVAARRRRQAPGA